MPALVGVGYSEGSVDFGCLEVFAENSDNRLKERVLSSISSLCRG